MTEEGKMKMMQGLLQNASINQLNLVVESGATVNYYGGEKSPAATTKSEEDVRRAVVQLMEERDEKGNYLLNDQQQFFAVKAVLTALCGFPVKPAEFAKVMHNLELDNLRVRYNYESVRKVAVHQLPQNVELWHQYQNTADEYSMKQVVVGVRLMELLQADDSQ